MFVISNSTSVRAPIICCWSFELNFHFVESVLLKFFCKDFSFFFYVSLKCMSLKYIPQIFLFIWYPCQRPSVALRDVVKVSNDYVKQTVQSQTKLFIIVR